MPAADPAVKNSKTSSPSRLPELQPQQKIALYRQMLLIRRFEEKAKQAFTQAKIKGFCHLYNGQEAVAVGTISVLNEDDAVITAYRDHGHALTRGVDPNACMAELFGKITGCSRGKGGSMHFFDAKKHFYGGHGIVGGQIPIGTGLAYAQKYLGTNRVTLAYMGDGAINQGAVHESMNLAALWKLPIIYIIENNEYSMGTDDCPLLRRRSADQARGRVRHGGDPGRRHGHRRRPGQDVRGRVAGAHRKPADPDGNPHLPLLWPLDVRSRPLSLEGRNRGRGARATRSNFTRRACSNRKSRPRRVSTRWTKKSWPKRRPPTISPSKVRSRDLRPCSRIFLRRKTKSPSSGPICAARSCRGQ